ncbi:MAG: hypothetical protein ABSB30_03410 [Terracidiphilus sp.]|jgi:hypothetical protein
MPIVRDFRNYSFLPARVDRCGRNVGAKLYWKLYAIENTIRVVIHSVLSVQIGANWWNVAVDQDIAARAQAFRRNYAARPQNANPGIHDIHLVYLRDLTEIIRANSNFFTPIVPNTNHWITILEGIRIPRNLVGHMNFPNTFDGMAIESAYAQLNLLLDDLKAYPILISIPR